MKLTLDMKKTFHVAVREAVDCRDRWYMPAKIWLLGGPGELWFEAHPDTVRLDDPNGEILLELSADHLNRLADALGTTQWDNEIN
mgnify:CR=1 FL=1